MDNTLLSKDILNAEQLLNSTVGDKRLPRLNIVRLIALFNILQLEITNLIAKFGSSSQTIPLSENESISRILYNLQDADEPQYPDIFRLLHKTERHVYDHTTTDHVILKKMPKVLEDKINHLQGLSSIERKLLNAIAHIQYITETANRSSEKVDKIALHKSNRVSTIRGGFR